MAITKQEIISGLTIKKLNGLKFGNEIAYCNPIGFALYHNDLGFLSFKEDNEKLRYGVKKPYSPQGGKKALESILKDGGLNNYDNIEWMQPM